MQSITPDRSTAGVIVNTFFVFALYYTFSYVHIYFFQMSIESAYGVNHPLLPKLSSIYIDLIFFVFVVVVSQISDRTTGDSSDYFSAAGWAWTALLILLSVIPALAGKSLLLSSEVAGENLIYCYLQLMSGDNNSTIIERKYSGILMCALGFCMFFSLYIAVSLSRHKQPISNDRVQFKNEFSKMTSIASVAVACGALFVYLTISHTNIPSIDCSVFTKGPNEVLRSAIIMIFFVICAIGVAKFYALYVLLPWASRRVDYWFIYALKLLLVFTFLGISVVILVDFLRNLNTISSIASIRHFYESVLNSIVSVFLFLSLFFDYAANLAQVFGAFLLFLFNRGIDIWDALGQFIVRHSRFIYYLAALMLAIPMWLAGRLLIRVVTRISIPTNLIKQIALYLFRALSIVVAAMALIFFIVIPIKDFVLEKYFTVKDKEENVAVVKPLQISCGETSPNWALSRTDAIEVDLQRCYVRWEQYLESCENNMIVAVGVSSSSGYDSVELERSKSRGLELVSRLLLDYGRVCQNYKLPPELYVLNLGKPIGDRSDSSDDRKLKAFLGQNIENESTLNEMLKAKVLEASYYQNWELVKVE